MCIFYKQHSVLRTHLWREENFPRIIKDFIPVTVVQYIQIDNVLTELSTQNNCSFLGITRQPWPQFQRANGAALQGIDA